MAYVVAEPCIGTKDRACVEVCPVSCFYENEDQLFIHPQECIDCDACVPVCPVTAIFPEAQVPEQWKYYIQKGIDYFAENTGVPPAKSKAEVGSSGVAEGSTHWAWKGQPAAAAKAAAAAAAASATAEAPPKPAPTPVTATAATLETPPTSAPAPVHAAVSAATEAPAAPAPAATLETPPTPAPAPVHAAAAAAAEAPAAAAPPKPAPAAPAAAAPAAKPAAKPAAPPPKPMDPEEYRQLQALLNRVMEMLGGSRPFDFAVFLEAEATGMRLKKEVALAFGKESYTASELEKKGVTLRQKHEVANSLLQAVERAQFIPRFRGKRQRLMQLAAGGAVTGVISVVSGLLSLRTVRIDTVLSGPTPSLRELLGSFVNPESLIPFLGLQTIAGLMGLFTLYAIYQCWRVSWELHELKRTMQAKHIDPRMIARLA